MNETIKNEIVRKVIISSILEPILEKQSCTSLFRQTSKSRIEHFLIAGVNIGFVFNDAIRHYQKEGVSGIYEYYYIAQKSSFLNRDGGRANQGIIEFLLPVAVSFIDCKKREATKILSHVAQILKKTNIKDVEWLLKGKNYAFKHSDSNKDKVIPFVGKNVFDHYLKCTDEKMLSNKGLPTYWSYFFREFADNFIITRFFYKKAKDYLIEKRINFRDGIVNAFNDTNKKFGKLVIGTHSHHGILADITALVIFLILIEYPDYRI